MTTILDYKTLDLSKIFFSDPSKIKGGSYMSLSYYNNSKNKTKNLIPLIVQTPKLRLSGNISKSDTRSYMELEFDKSHWPFFEFISGVDEHSIVYIQKNSSRWFSKTFPLDVVDEFYKTPIKAARNKNPPKLKLKLPLSKGIITCNIYNNNNNIIEYTDVLDGDEVICVMQLIGLRFLKQQVICEWNPIQLKVYKDQTFTNLSNYVIDDTLISDDEHDNNVNNLQEELNKKTNTFNLDTEGLDSIEIDKDQENLQVEESIDIDIKESNDQDLDNTELQESINTDIQDSNIKEQETSEIQESNIQESGNKDIEKSKIEESNIQESNIQESNILESKNKDIEESNIEESNIEESENKDIEESNIKEPENIDINIDLEDSNVNTKDTTEIISVNLNANNSIDTEEREEVDLELYDTELGEIDLDNLTDDENIEEIKNTDNDNVVSKNQENSENIEEIKNTDNDNVVSENQENSENQEIIENQENSEDQANSENKENNDIILDYKQLFEETKKKLSESENNSLEYKRKLEILKKKFSDLISELN